MNLRVDGGWSGRSWSCVCASSGEDVEKGLECGLKWKGEIHSIQTVKSVGKVSK